MLAERTPGYIEALLRQAQEDCLLIRPALIAVRAALEAEGCGLDTEAVETFRSRILEMHRKVHESYDFFELDASPAFFFGQNASMLALAWAKDVQQAIGSKSTDDDWCLSRSEKKALDLLLAGSGMTPAALATVITNKDLQRDTRVASLYQLNKMASPALLPLLFSMLKLDDRDFRQKAYRYERNITKEERDALISEYEDGRLINAKVIRLAHRFARGADAVKAFVPYLDTEDWYYGSYLEVMVALGRTQSKDAIPILLPLLADADHTRDSERQYVALTSLSLLALDCQLSICDIPENIVAHSQQIQEVLEKCARIFMVARPESEQVAAASF